MNWFQIFYWLTVADNARCFFGWATVIFTIVVVISAIVYFTAFSDDLDEVVQPMARKWLWWSTPFCIIFWCLYIFTPSKKDALFIIAGGGALQFLTQDSTARQIPREMSNFVLTQLKSMSKEAQVELGIQTEKDRILDEAKTLSGQELLNRIQTDSLFRKLLLE